MIRSLSHLYPKTMFFRLKSEFPVRWDDIFFHDDAHLIEQIM